MVGFRLAHILRLDRRLKLPSIYQTHNRQHATHVLWHQSFPSECHFSLTRVFFLRENKIGGFVWSFFFGSLFELKRPTASLFFNQQEHLHSSDHLARGSYSPSGAWRTLEKQHPGLSCFTHRGSAFSYRPRFLFSEPICRHWQAVAGPVTHAHLSDFAVQIDLFHNFIFLACKLSICNLSAPHLRP